MAKFSVKNSDDDFFSEGEMFFLNIALKTFCDCSNFEIIDKSKSPHSGDFWLKFDKFTIMVDSKNYIDTPVPIRDRVKNHHKIINNYLHKIISNHIHKIINNNSKVLHHPQHHHPQHHPQHHHHHPRQNQIIKDY